MNRASSPLFYLYFRIEFQQIHPIFGISQTSIKGKPTGDRPFLVVLVPGFPVQILPEANPLNQVLITKHVQQVIGDQHTKTRILHGIQRTNL